ncbi:hypothetical protein ACYCFK_17715 [Stutzerimonas stutzeri]
MSLALRSNAAFRAGQSRWDHAIPPEPSQDDLLYESILDQIDRRDVETIQAYAEFVAGDIDSDQLRDLLFGVLMHSDQRWISRVSLINCDPLSEPLSAMRLEADRRMAAFIEYRAQQLTAGEQP